MTNSPLRGVYSKQPLQHTEPIYVTIAVRNKLLFFLYLDLIGDAIHVLFRETNFLLSPLCLSVYREE